MEGLSSSKKGLLFRSFEFETARLSNSHRLIRSLPHLAAHIHKPLLEHQFEQLWSKFHFFHSMWILDAIDVPNVEAQGSHLLVPGCYTVGRTENESDLLCLNNSISRKHAQIEVRRLEDGQGLPEFYLTGNVFHKDHNGSHNIWLKHRFDWQKLEGMTGDSIRCALVSNRPCL